MSTAYLIDATNRTITKIELAKSSDAVRQMNELLDDYLTMAYVWRNTGDVLFVGDNGMRLKPDEGFVIPERPDQPLFGNGVLVGKEVVEHDEDGEEISWHNADCTMTLDNVEARVMFWFTK